jgi:hypothetical protein
LLDGSGTARLSGSVRARDPADKNKFPGLAQAVAGSDLVLVSIRRRTPPNEQLDAIRAHLAAGKPLVGIRTASHAFAVRDQNTPLASGATTWPEFDLEVLGGHYGHHGAGPKVATAPLGEAPDLVRRDFRHVGAMVALQGDCWLVP